MTIERPRSVLIHPDSRGNYVQSTIPRENLGLGYLSSYLQANGFDTEIYDARMERDTPEVVAQEILERGLPAIVGLSLITIEGASWSEELAAIIKRESKGNRPPHITLGNYFPTLQPERALNTIPSADSVVRSEGELTMLDLSMKVISGQDWQNTQGIIYRAGERIQINPRRQKIRNLDELPYPEHYATRYELNEFAVEGSRGCYCRCSFCALDPFTQAESPSERWRARSPANIVDEITKTRQRYPDVDLYRFIDADFIGAQKHADRVRDFVDELGASRQNIGFIIDARSKEVVGLPKKVWQDLRDVGLREVYLGIETATPGIKRRMRKGSTVDDDKRAVDTLTDLGINVRFGWMMVTPWTREDDVLNNAQILHDLGFARLDKYFQEMNLIPGTDAIELTEKVAKIWPDFGNPDYYTYEVPAEIDNLRRIGRTLTREQLVFMERFMVMHKRIEEQLHEKAGGSEVLRDRLNDLNFSFFSSVFEAARKLGEDATTERVSDISKDLVNNFESEVSQLERDI